MDERLQKIRQTIIIAAQNWRVPVIALRNRLLAGIAVSIPLIVTVWVLKLGYNFINDISEPYLKVFGINYPGVPFLVTLALLLIAGTMATHVIGRRVLGFADRQAVDIVATAGQHAGNVGQHAGHVLVDVDQTVGARRGRQRDRGQVDAE